MEGGGRSAGIAPLNSHARQEVEVSVQPSGLGRFSLCSLNSSLGWSQNQRARAGNSADIRVYQHRPADDSRSTISLKTKDLGLKKTLTVECSRTNNGHTATIGRKSSLGKRDCCTSRHTQVHYDQLQTHENHCCFS